MGPILVIGATGLVGKALANELQAEGLDFLGTSRSGSTTDLACDLLDPDSVEEALRLAMPSQIVLAAGKASVRQAKSDPTAAFSVNTGGAATLLDAARKIAPESHLLLVSTAAASGAPDSIYSSSKAAAELMFESHGRQTGQPVAIARLHNQIGPGLGQDHAPGEFARTIVKAEMSGQSEVSLKVGNPKARRDYLDVRDTAGALALITKHGLIGRYEVCKGESVPLSRLVEALGESTQLSVHIQTVEGRAHRPGIDAINGNPQALQEKTGWKPRISLEQSALALLDSLRN